MCLCKGKGGVPLLDGAVIQWHPCPDSNCSHDKAAVLERMAAQKQESIDWQERLKEEGVII